MKSIIIVISLMTLILSGCSSIKIVPAAGSGLINKEDNSIELSSDDITLKAIYEPIELYSQNLNGYITAFRLTLTNKSKKEISIDYDSFLLLDEKNRQYHALVPAKVKEIMSRDTYYLIPYPYTGFYYLEDYEKSRFINQNSSSLPYYYEVYPQEIYSRAIQPGIIIPEGVIEGVIYFNTDPSIHEKLNIYFYRKGTTKSTPAEITVPFTVQK